MINGNVSGVRRALLEEMEALYAMRVFGEFVSTEIVEALASFTESTKREISVYISRDGRVVDVSLGESASVSMPEMRIVRSLDHLSGVRCIHTHPGGDSFPPRFYAAMKTQSWPSAKPGRIARLSCRMNSCWN